MSAVAYFNRVREAAMTSLMEITLLLTRTEPALIDANMYVLSKHYMSAFGLLMVTSFGLSNQPFLERLLQESPLLIAISCSHHYC